MSLIELEVNKIKLKKEYPKCYEELLKHSGGVTYSIYADLDSFFYKIGIDLIVQSIHDKHDKIIGHEAYIKYFPNNIFGAEPNENLIIQDYKKFKKIEKAYKEGYRILLNQLEERLALHVPQ